MIKKYVYGNPFPTDAVIVEVETSTDRLPFFETDDQADSPIPFPMVTLSTVWDNRFGASIKEDGSMSAGIMTIPTTMRIPVPYTVRIILLSLAVK